MWWSDAFLWRGTESQLMDLRFRLIAKLISCFVIVYIVYKYVKLLYDLIINVTVLCIHQSMWHRFWIKYETGGLVKFDVNAGQQASPAEKRLSIYYTNECIRIVPLCVVIQYNCGRQSQGTWTRIWLGTFALWLFHYNAAAASIKPENRRRIVLNATPRGQ